MQVQCHIFWLKLILFFMLNLPFLRIQWWYKESFEKQNKTSGAQLSSSECTSDSSIENVFLATKSIMSLIYDFDRD